MLRAIKAVNGKMSVYAAFLIFAILILSPVSLALSQEAPRPEEDNTLAEGLKAVQEAEGRIGEADSKEAADGDGDSDDTAAQKNTQTEDDSGTKPLSEAQAEDAQTETQDTAATAVTEKDGLPRGEALRNPEKPRYDSSGMRDPFKPFIKLVDRPSGPAPIIRPPIRRYPLSSFRLAGIIWIGDEPRAMIVDPETNTYFLGVGDRIGNKEGEILEVRERGILVQEKTKLENVYGEVRIEVKKSVLAFQN